MKLPIPESEKEAQTESMERYFSYDLYNTATEEVEVTELKTPDEVARLNRALLANNEPQRWLATPWVNH